MNKTICYIAMLIFDFAVFFGLYRILENGGSYWWILLAVLLSGFSSPKLYME